MSETIKKKLITVYYLLFPAEQVAYESSVCEQRLHSGMEFILMVDDAIAPN